MASIFDKFKYLIPKERSANNHQQLNEGGRDWENMYRDRWSFDKCVRSTHGVNCTGSCSWNIYVKNGLVAWENQVHDYPETSPEMPDFEPRGCPRGASFSWYLYSPHRIKYPYLRGELAELWREARKNFPTALEAWQSIANDPAKMKKYKQARGMCGFVRSTWDEVSELVAASLLHTVQKYGPDRIFGFSVIPAKSMLSYAAGLRFVQLMGGAGLSFYDWYADLPPASPQVWGDQTDVPESSDWFNAGYIITWGSNVPLTRTPDAHFLTEARYKGTKVVSVAPDYAESTTVADTWINLKTGSDAAFAMAMGHVILREYYWGEPADFFIDYAKKFTDFPFLVILDEKDGKYQPGRFLNAKDFGRTDKHAEFKHYVIDEISNKLVIPNGTMGDRWDRQSKWNLREENSDTGEKIAPKLSILNERDDVAEILLPYFGNDRGNNLTLTRAVPVKKIKTSDGVKLVTTVYDLTLANYGIDTGLGGECANSYEQDTPYTPRWQEKFTGVKADMVIHTAREFADNALKTRGRTMVIMGGGINHWFHADVVYRTILNLLLFCACEGRNGGGWAHYVGQEKLRPAEGWARLMTATDWQGGAKIQNSTSYFYFATDQWRSEEVDTLPLVAQTEKPRYRHPGDYNVLAARLGWLPSYPTFNKSGQKIYDEATAAGFSGIDNIKKYVAQSLKNKSLQFAIEDPDAPENFPRNMFIWRNNLIGKGHDYFLKYLLGTKNSLFAEEESPIKPTEIKYRSNAEISRPGGALEGKLDLLVDIDFRMASSALYADVVLPTATWYEKTDLSSTDMHPFVHPFQPAVDPLWEARTDWDIFRTLAKAVSKVAAESNFPIYKDVFAAPIQHDSEGETAQPEGKILDWSKGDCEPVAGKTMPAIGLIERDYTKIYDKWIALGPNIEKGMGSKGMSWQSKQDYEEIRIRNGIIEDKNLISYGMPSVFEAKQACDAVMGLSTTTNGSVAVRAWKDLEKKTGLENLAALASDRESERFTFDMVAIQPRETITSPTFTGSNQNRRYTPFSTNIEQLIPFRTVTGRQAFYVDHEMMREWGETMSVYKPILEFRPLKNPVGGAKEITQKFLTPHNKWSTHSMYFDSQQMLTLFRGGQTVWTNEKDAAEIDVKDNDWLEVYNRNGVVAARAVVTPRLPRGIAFMYHAQDRHINAPGSKISGTRGGTHNTPTRIHMKPTHMIGGYGQLSYGFNYYGSTGNQRDIYIVARKMEEVDWLAQIAMVMNLDKCIGCHTCSITCKNVWTNREGAEYMYFNNVETKPGVGYPRDWENQEKWKGGWQLSGDELSLKTGSKLERILKLFYHPEQPEMKDYYEPWTYDYETLINSKRKNHQPVARPRSLITQRRMEIKAGPNWDDDLAGGESARKDYNLKKVDADITLEFQDIFMKYLPRNCNHCLNPACVAACPSDAIYKRDEDGVVLVSQDACRGWRHCIPACPYKKIYYNWKTNKAEKCTFCYPRLENGLPTVCTDTCVGRIRYLGVIFYDADAVFDAAKTSDEKNIYFNLLDVIQNPNSPEVQAAARAEGISEAWIRSAEISPVYQIIKTWKLALPLHPEYRTLPMVWYIPPLSPIMKNVEDKVYLPKSDAMRIPLKYLAELFAAGNVEVIAKTLQRLLDMRMVMRQKEISAPMPQNLEFELGEYEKMYRLLGIAKYGERIKLPAGIQGRTPEQLRELQGSAGYVCPGGFS